MTNVFSFVAFLFILIMVSFSEQKNLDFNIGRCNKNFLYGLHSHVIRNHALYWGHRDTLLFPFFSSLGTPS